ncbi:hypothetical protein OAT18_02175 [Tenacibaculum sp.]|nr:hypothetical protein [Tenacibaculum sp.]
MQKHLYFLCPTDCIEPVINKTFKQENYFYSSLGNSFIFEHKTIESIKQLIRKYHIKKISFVLSINNDIVKDALGSQSFIKMRGLTNLYYQIIKQKKHSEIFWKTDYSQFSVLSYYLNSKIKELQLELGDIIDFPLEINGKIYDRFDNVFKNIYSDLICIEKHCLN